MPLAGARRWQEQALRCCRIGPLPPIPSRLNHAYNCNMPLQNSNAKAAVVASVEDKERILTLVQKLGEISTAKHLRISRQTLGRILGGLNLQLGTLVLVRQELT